MVHSFATLWVNHGLLYIYMKIYTVSVSGVFGLAHAFPESSNLHNFE